MAEENELKQLGRYRIIGELGSGAMGMVYKAQDPMLNRTVAVKTIIMSDDATERAEYEARFYQEAKATGGLNHPNLIMVHDIGKEGDLVYMAMELLDGVELREVMARGRIPLSQALDIVAQVADGLHYAHEQGVVHRDIKPGNIMIGRNQRAKIMDFGIARMRASDIKTQTGVMLGSPKYMSPEQVAALPADGRSDIFSLGIVLYELATGQAPFSAPDISQYMYQLAIAQPKPPSQVDPTLPHMLDLIVAKAMAKEPVQRYQDAAEFAADLRACRAQLNEPAPAPAAPRKVPIEDSVQLDTTVSRTQRIEAALDATGLTLIGSNTDTLPIGTVSPGSVVTATGMSGASTQFSLSPRFDSAAALARLKESGVARKLAAENARRRTSFAGMVTRIAFLGALGLAVYIAIT